MQVHLTIDDTPWMLERGQAMAISVRDAQRWNDRILATLKARDVRASAFFTCERLREGDGIVADWVTGGHAIGNHTQRHLQAKEVGPEAYLADTAACQSVLRSRTGAAPRWFRYTYLGYGATEQDQGAIRRGLAGLGLRNLPVTVPTTEWVFAHRYRHALAEGDQALQERLVEAYLTHMDDALAAAVDLAEALEGRAIPQTVLVHVNELNAHHLGTVMDRWAAAGVEFVGADEAMADDVFAKPVTRVVPFAVPWVVRVHDEPLDEVTGWFGAEEERVVAAWHDQLPAEAWHRGLPAVAESAEELTGWLRAEGYVGELRAGAWPIRGRGGEPPASPGGKVQIARLIDESHATDGFHHSYDLRCTDAPGSHDSLAKLAVWAASDDGLARPSVALPFPDGGCVASVITASHQPLLDAVVDLAGVDPLAAP